MSAAGAADDAKPKTNNVMIPMKNDSNLSGVVGEGRTLRSVRGKLVVKNRPKRQPGRAAPDSKLEAAKARFLEAAQYGRQQISMAESKELYAKRVTAKKRSAYAVAMSDYLVE